MIDARWHLAQLNVGRMLAPVGAPEIAGFMAALDPMPEPAGARPASHLPHAWRPATLRRS